MKIRLARKIVYTRTTRRGTLLQALRRLPWGEYVAYHRWYRWDLVRDVQEKWGKMSNKNGFVPLVVLGYIAATWILGVGIADYMDPPKWPRYPGTISWCRPHPYDKMAWKPWPFRRGRYTNNWREGDTDICTGEVYRDGEWGKR